jgi:hypothetical protein
MSSNLSIKLFSQLKVIHRMVTSALTSYMLIRDTRHAKEYFLTDSMTLYHCDLQNLPEIQILHRNWTNICVNA